jgi:hypothetical protein
MVELALSAGERTNALLRNARCDAVIQVNDVEGGTPENSVPGGRGLVAVDECKVAAGHRGKS